MKRGGTLLTHLRKNVKERNYAALPFPLRYKKLSEAADSFFEFLALPLEVKKKFYLIIDDDDPESIVGYVKRQQKEGDLDEKEYFHYNRYAETGFRELKDELGPTAKRFFNYAEIVYEAAEQAMEEVIADFETEYSGIYKQFFPGSRHPHFYLRFLKYNVMGKGNFLAGGHYDQGACTFALAESAPGLRIGLNESKLEHVEHKDGQLIFMPGLQMRLFTSDEFTPAWHDVVQRGEDTLTSEVARWSIVFFADPIVKRQTSWQERHKPMF